MALFEKFKQLLGRDEERGDGDFWGTLDKRITELEDRIHVTHDTRRFEGDLGSVEAACKEILSILSRAGEGAPVDPHVVPSRQRVELVRDAVRIISGQDAERARLWDEFIRTLSACRNYLSYKTRAKYDRLRLDYESRRRT